MKTVAYVVMLTGVLIGGYAVYDLYVAHGAMEMRYVAFGGGGIAIVGMILKTIADSLAAKKKEQLPQ